jgi:hypothetical protein
MNDSDELYWLFRLAEGGFSREEKERYPTLIEKIQRILKDRPYGQVYATCFSEDDDSLSQWRAYADDGRGVAMGFRFTVPDPLGHVELHKVIYDDDKAQRLLALCKQEILEQDYDTELQKRIAEAVFLDEVITCAAKVKNKGFESEREWRLIHHCKHVEDFTMGVRAYRESRGLVVPYHSYELKRCSLKRVVFGPKTNLPINAPPVEWMLKQHGHKDAELDKSKLSDR